MERKNSIGFTLVEVLIVIGVVGVVAALTLPTLIANIQERVRTEQTRVVKQKLTDATSEMNVLGRIHEYPSTSDFVNELEQHFKITCKSTTIRDC